MRNAARRTNGRSAKNASKTGRIANGSRAKRLEIDRDPFAGGQLVRVRASNDRPTAPTDSAVADRTQSPDTPFSAVPTSDRRNMTKTTEEAGYDLVKALLKFNDGSYGGRERMVHKPAWKMLFMMLKYLNSYPELTSLPYQMTPIVLHIPSEYHQIVLKDPMIVQRLHVELLPIKYGYREFWKSHINRSRALPYQYLLWEGGFVLVVFCFYAIGDNVIRVVNITIHFSKKDEPEPLCYQDKLMLEECYPLDTFNPGVALPKPVSINTNRWTILRELKESRDKKGNEMFLLSLLPLMDELSDQVLKETRRKMLELLEESMSWKRNFDC